MMEEEEQFQQGEVTVPAWAVMAFRSLWNSGARLPHPWSPGHS